MVPPGEQGIKNAQFSIRAVPVEIVHTNQNLLDHVATTHIYSELKTVFHGNKSIYE